MIGLDRKNAVLASVGRKADIISLSKKIEDVTAATIKALRGLPVTSLINVRDLVFSNHKSCSLKLKANFSEIYLKSKRNE